jgi:crotonobetainyl-CoA:carnitine CoA-transferase CaiB-like acyl-CoA transferase
MTDGMIAFNTIFGATYLVDGIEHEPEKTVLNGGSIYDYYETRDGQYISFGGLEPQFFANFCQTLKKQIANPIKFSYTKQVYKSIGVAASTGNHTKEIFRELGYTEDEIEAFVETGLFN